MLPRIFDNHLSTRVQKLFDFVALSSDCILLLASITRAADIHPALFAKGVNAADISQLYEGHLLRATSPHCPADDLMISQLGHISWSYQDLCWSWPFKHLLLFWVFTILLHKSRNLECSCTGLRGWYLEEFNALQVIFMQNCMTEWDEVGVACLYICVPVFFCRIHVGRSSNSQHYRLWMRVDNM